MSATTLANGASEIDTVVLRLPDYGQEVRNWSRYTYNDAFLTPVAGWSFSVSDEDTTLTQQLLVPGARVELVINNNVQCSGFIEHKVVDSDTGGGTNVTVSGRDILGPVVDATVDPAFKFQQGITVPELVLGVLAPFGIKVIYNADLFNIYVVSGFDKGSGRGGPIAVQAKQQKTTVNADGTLSLSYTTVAATQYVSPLRPDLRTLTADQIKPNWGEGVWTYLERLLRRLGLMMWAAADGSGVVIDKADFATAPQMSIVHKRGDTSRNNVKRGRLELDQVSQPSCIIAKGMGGGQATSSGGLVIVMVNELTGLDDQGNVLPEILNIKARYKSAKVLPIRPQLVPFQRPLGDQKIAKPFFLKDDESKNLAQLEAFTRRKMAEFQMKGFQASYDLIGHTLSGHPWAINTNVAVDDEVLGIQETLWIVERTFTKSSGDGTAASLKLIRPYTLQIAQ